MGPMQLLWADSRMRVCPLVSICLPVCSHSQASGGDQANAIYLELERMGFKVCERPVSTECRLSSHLVRVCSRGRPQVWYDNRASDLTKEGMLKGIERAAAFILFLSVDVLQRPYCQMEIRHALALKKPVVLIHGA